MTYYKCKYYRKERYGCDYSSPCWSDRFTFARCDKIYLDWIEYLLYNKYIEEVITNEKET